MLITTCSFGPVPARVIEVDRIRTGRTYIIQGARVRYDQGAFAGHVVYVTSNCIKRP